MPSPLNSTHRSGRPGELRPLHSASSHVTLATLCGLLLLHFFFVKESASASAILGSQAHRSSGGVGGTVGPSRSLLTTMQSGGTDSFILSRDGRDGLVVEGRPRGGPSEAKVMKQAMAEADIVGATDVAACCCWTSPAHSKSCPMGPSEFTQLTSPTSTSTQADHPLLSEGECISTKPCRRLLPPGLLVVSGAADSKVGVMSDLKIQEVEER
ncbi:hypothetical protein V8E36_009606 [Tilletia maclaganii]